MIEQWTNIAIMLPRSQLRHYAAKNRVRIRLACENRANEPAFLHKSKAGVIAGALYAKAKHNLLILGIDAVYGFHIIL